MKLAGCFGFFLGSFNRHPGRASEKQLRVVADIGDLQRFPQLLVALAQGVNRFERGMIVQTRSLKVNFRNERVGLWGELAGEVFNRGKEQRATHFVNGMAVAFLYAVDLNGGAMLPGKTQRRSQHTDENRDREIARDRDDSHQYQNKGIGAWNGAHDA